MWFNNFWTTPNIIKRFIYNGKLYGFIYVGDYFHYDYTFYKMLENSKKNLL